MGNSRTKNSALTMAMSSMRQLLTILLTFVSRYSLYLYFGSGIFRVKRAIFQYIIYLGSFRVGYRWSYRFLSLQTFSG